MHAHDEHLLVVRTVEDPDVSCGPAGAARSATGSRGRAPRRRSTLKPWTETPLRVHTAHHVADRPVLAGRVHRLQDHQHADRVLRRQARLVLACSSSCPDSSRATPSFFLLMPALNAGSKSSAEPHLRPRLHAERLDEVLRALLRIALSAIVQLLSAYRQPPNAMPDPPTDHAPKRRRRGIPLCRVSTPNGELRIRADCVGRGSRAVGGA